MRPKIYKHDIVHFAFSQQPACMQLKQFSSFRDALSKALYSRLFSWLVKKANAVISKADKDMSLAILDIFGFEVHMGVTGNTFAVSKYIVTTDLVHVLRDPI